MSVQFQNYEYSYRKNGKPYFAPNNLGRRIGADIKSQIERTYDFDDFVYHLKSGGHVAALHAHRPQAFFSKADIKQYFYSISRSKVQRALAQIGVLRSRHYAKWSCVKNPYGAPAYALPYGFVQSPILATLVLMESVVGDVLRRLHNTDGLVVSLYMDDIAVSSDDMVLLTSAHDEILQALGQANFELSQNKICAPASEMTIFNCELETGFTTVSGLRINEFYAIAQSAESISGFELYKKSVEAGNN